MELQENIILAREGDLKPPVKVERSKPAKRRQRRKEVVEPMPTERDSLEVHVDICQLRYQQLEDRIGRIETKVGDINIDLQDFKEEMRDEFADVKDLLGQAKDSKFNTMVTTAGTVIVALLAMLGYIIIHLPK
jgi:uncharacterized protein involved in exopolysaccharide biosynthesis